MIEGLDRWHRGMARLVRRSLLPMFRGAQPISIDAIDRFRIDFEGKMAEWHNAPLRRPWAGSPERGCHA
jgi:hypothetical protein